MLHLAISGGRGAAEWGGGGPEHATEAGLGGADRVDVGGRSGRYGDCAGDRQDQEDSLRWRARYIERGVRGLERDASRPGRKKPLSAALIERVVDMTLHERPPAATQWSARVMAKAVGLSHTS